MMKRATIPTVVLALVVVGLVARSGAGMATGGNSITSPDTDGWVGQWPSLALDALGNPVVSYYDAGDDDLKVLHCSNPNCTSGNSITSPDTGGDVGTYTSLALDASGNPVVSYYDASNDDLKVLHCSNPNCTSGNSITSPDTAGNVGRFTSLVLDTTGDPVVSYLDDTNDDLKVLHCDDPKCEGDEGGNTTSPDTGGNVGWYTSLALDASGNPVVGYSGNGELKVLHCGDPDCTSGNSISSLGTSFGWTSLALDALGNPVVSYWGYNDLKVLRCGNANCTTGNSITSPDAHWVGMCTSLALDASGNPVVSYGGAWFTGGMEPETRLKVLHCGDPNCAAGNSITRADKATDVAWYNTSLALDALGNPVVSYQDATNDDLKVLHCIDPNCLGVAPVGGIAAELPEVAGRSAEGAGAEAGGSGWSAGTYAAVAGGVAAMLALAAGAWYARRRWVR
jgi:hypothetical protein